MSEGAQEGQPYMHRLLSQLTYLDEFAGDLDSFLALRMRYAWKWTALLDFEFDDERGPVVVVSAIPEGIPDPNSPGESDMCFGDKSEDQWLKFRLPVSKWWDSEFGGPGCREERKDMIAKARQFLDALEAKEQAR